MAIKAQIEAAKPIAAKRIGATLKNDNRRVVVVNNRRYNRLEERMIAFIIDAFAQRHVDRIIAAATQPNVVPKYSKASTLRSTNKHFYRMRLHVAGAGEEKVAVFMKRNGHDAIRKLKCLLNAVAVMNIDVNIKNSKSYIRNSFKYE